MYHDFYQLKENPFNVTADPDFFYSSKVHTEAIFNLEYGIEQRKGILVVTGEVGTGKTTLCRKLLRNMTRETRFALILNPNLSNTQLLQMIIQDLGVTTKSKNKFELIQILNKYLLEESSRGHNVVLVIDEAQNLKINQLEEIRLLSNLETEKEKLLQIVLLGQPELYKKLQMPSMRQLRQRISVFFHLRPLERDDIKQYILHRLTTALKNPAQSPQLEFSDKAIDTIYSFTQGSPRSINLLCDRALVAGFVNEVHAIDQQIIENCAKEVLYFEHYL